MLSNPKLWKKFRFGLYFFHNSKGVKKVFIWGTLFKTKFAVETASPQKYLGAPELTRIALVKFIRVLFLRSATPFEDGEYNY